MIDQARGLEHLHLIRFNFYTQDQAGCDIKISIFAGNVNAARDKFDRIYSKDTVVDFIHCPSYDGFADDFVL